MASNSSTSRSSSEIILLEIAISLPMAYAIKKSAFSRAFGVGTPPGSKTERLLPATNFTFRETWNLNSLLDLRAPLSHYPSYEPDDDDEWGKVHSQTFHG
ncbi:hypothetical protein SNOG_04775 [Parastagonospora nodorum SN15]|uniref:Uncharacterized protein n=1 Tax=Phaeosphaeria nodorum (strain SN15 / ATCC MYA-4574 / FGSC 10173) TaxID=321614 RepID=Q0UTY9_PHANO|nr:hypothetical protein SNOG_04775 [Parastagonospora nodorum SN15]EAT87166.1 hypothetical protein SNOG_04775 [Parastagonospora nodorum SN15]